MLQYPGGHRPAPFMDSPANLSYNPGPIIPAELAKMVVFRPFRGCRFNPQVVGDPASVLCPPYDMIGPGLQQSLKGLSPYNAVHLEGGEQPDPVDPAAGYRQAAGLFQQWLAQEVLLRDSQPRFYLMRHGYRFLGEEKSHLGLFGGVQVEDYASGVVLPHEYTREPAVRDRVFLLEACKAQFSPTLHRVGPLNAVIS